MFTLLLQGGFGPLLTLIIGTGVACGIFIATKGGNQKSKFLPLPPGPTGLPIVGNLPKLLRNVRKGTHHLLFERWARQYGGLYRVHLGPISQYIINSDVAVKAILDNNAAVSSERPRFIVLNEHMCNRWNMVVSGVNALWRHQRKVIMTNFGSVQQANAKTSYWDFETLRFLEKVSTESFVQQDNKQLWKAVITCAYSASASQMFGLSILDDQDESIEYIHETATAQILGLLPGNYIVEALPFLENLPLAFKPWAREGDARFKRDVEWCTSKMSRLEAIPDSERGDVVQNSLLYKILKDEEHLGFESKEVGAFLCLELTIASADNTQLSIWSFVEAMLLYPGIQRRAQALIDEYVGDRIPAWADFERIPYVRCLVKETWRWRPTTGFGLPHVNTEEIIYNNMRIPKGSHIYINAWALHRNPQRHENPNDFVPERYEHDNTSTMQSINIGDATKRDHFAFGAGRRVCPGYNIAERALALAIMRILWAFDIVPSTKAKYPLDSFEWRGTYPWLPGPDMPVTFTPRGKDKTRSISQAFSQTRALRGPAHSL